MIFKLIHCAFLGEIIILREKHTCSAGACFIYCLRVSGFLSLLNVVLCSSSKPEDLAAVCLSSKREKLFHAEGTMYEVSSCWNFEIFIHWLIKYHCPLQNQIILESVSLDGIQDICLKSTFHKILYDLYTNTWFILG